MIDKKQYAHPMDTVLMEQILSSAGGRGLMDMIAGEGLDQACDAVLDRSYARLPEDDPMYGYLREGQDLFGGTPVRAICLVRDYEYEIACHGFSHPVLLVPSCLVRRGDRDIQRARMYAGAAAVAMGHHKIEFLVWLLNCLGGNTPIPFATEALTATLNEWYRSRRSTLDRAVYLASGDLELSLKNILYGQIPFEMLEKFRFGTESDTFLDQVRELESMAGVGKTASRLVAMMQRESWLPNRYRDLLNYAHQHRGGV